MNNTRVLRILNRFNLGGITYNVSYLSRYMPAQYETMLIGGPEEKNEASSLYIPQSLGLKPLVIEEMRRSVNPFADYLAYRRIKKIIRHFKPQLVHTHASKAGALGRLAAIRCGVPVIVHTFHGHVFEAYFGKIKTGIYKKIERYLARRSTALIAISNLQKHELADVHGIAPPEKFYVIPLGFDLRRFAEQKEEKRIAFRKKHGLGSELALGIIGRLVPVKDHPLFVDAVAEIIKNHGIRVRAVIVGDGECKPAIIARIRGHGLSFTEKAGEPADFIFAGWIREVDQVLPGLDLVCLTSRNEGTPVSLIEAQAAGKFIVSTEVGGIRDILEQQCGLLSKPGDAEAYKKNLLQAVRQYATLSAGAGVASEEVIRKFSHSRLCDDMDKLYQELLSQASSR